MTVRANLGFALKVAHVPKSEVADRVGTVAKMLNLDTLLDRKPAALSGGQRQRVAIGRALVRQPRAFLFDEPLSNLDAALRSQMRFEIRRLQQDLGITAIYVTHDQAEAMTMADQIVVFRDGRIEQVGTPLEIYQKPANIFVAGFIGSPQMNFLAGSHADKYDATTIGIRPEHLRIDMGGSLKGIVRTIEHLGNEALVHVQLEDGAMLTTRCAEDVTARPGEAIAFFIDPTYVHRFDHSDRSMPAAK
jgi:multiple sugar transport system ATP-binding protein